MQYFSVHCATLVLAAAAEGSTVTFAMIYQTRLVQKSSAFNLFVPQARNIGCRRALQVLAYKVTLDTPAGTHTFECDPEVAIVDQAQVFFQ
jgi:hypothetical protein